MRRRRRSHRYVVGQALALALAMAAFSPSTHAAAETFIEPSFQDLVRASDLIVVGVVASIDERYGLPSNEPMTRVELSVERILRGTGAELGKTFSILHRGGARADGLAQAWSSAPALTAGDKYVFFVKRDFFVAPFIPSSFSVMRVIQAGGREVLATKGGQLLSASPTIGLMVGGVAVDSLSERRAKAQAGTAEIFERVERVSAVHDASRVFALIEQVAETVEPGHRFESATKPKPLPASMVNETSFAPDGTVAPKGGTHE